MSQQAPAGWYPDGSGNQRYWDGAAWTEHLRTPSHPDTGGTGAINDYRNRTFRGNDLDGVDLKGLDFTGSTFIDLTWSGRDLTEAILDDTQFIGGSLMKASLAFTSISGARLEGVDLRGASLEGAVISRARFAEVDLTAADLTMIRMSDSVIDGARVDRASFRFARLVGSGFNFIRGEAADFREAVLDELTWADEGTLDIVLPIVNFSGAKIQGITWPGARLDGANFTAASVDRAVFAHADLSDADFTDAVLSNVIFDDADLSRADFTESYAAPSPAAIFLMPAEPRTARLRDVGFRGANLTNARLNGAILLRCDLTDANGEAAEFQGTRFDECVLEGVRWTEAAPGWLTSDEETRAEMFASFIEDGIALPYVPLEEDFDIVWGEGMLFHSSAWSGVTANDLYTFDAITNRLRADEVTEGFAVSMGGHGANSYAWTWACSENDLRATVQIGRGQVYRDAGDVARRWDEAMRGVSRVFELNRPLLPGPLAVEFSDIRQVACWRWIADKPSALAGTSTAAQEWQGDHTNVKAFFDDLYEYLQRVIKAP
ncbi:pentapeptide repeat-containing protein [Microbacterium sp. KHB019]|uniref:pentapeptide repeat-containing protein n=1 Tax=Microbacterium sp. KHB019 TaxID=3129770 RepID=UPI00307A2BBE